MEDLVRAGKVMFVKSLVKKLQKALMKKKKYCIIWFNKVGCDLNIRWAIC